MDEAKLEERLARLEQVVARSLDLLGGGDVDAARELLSDLVGPESAPPPAAAAAPVITDDELEQAFAGAEPETDQMRHADDVAQQAILQADLALEADGEMAPDEVGDNFSTETMAQLLERQGDAHGADRIRAALEAHEASPAARRSGRQNVVATLERWLDNIRGGARA